MKKIVTILIILAMVFSLTACGKSNEDTTGDSQEHATEVYLKWSDGDELLENVKHVYYARDRAVWRITFEDGSQIITGYANVIIVKK